MTTSLRVEDTLRLSSLPKVIELEEAMPTDGGGDGGSDGGGGGW